MQKMARYPLYEVRKIKTIKTINNKNRATRSIIIKTYISEPKNCWEGFVTYITQSVKNNKLSIEATNSIPV